MGAMQQKQAFGAVGVVVSACILTFGFISLHDLDVYQNQQIAGVPTDIDEMILGKPSDEPGKNAVTGIAVLMIIQTLIYIIDAWYADAEDKDKDTGNSKTQGKIAAAFNSAFRSMCTVNVVVTTVITVLLWVQRGSDGMVMVHDLVLISIALQARAMYANWSATMAGSGG